jgi:hypothetical protein
VRFAAVGIQLDFGWENFNPLWSTYHKRLKRPGRGLIGSNHPAHREQAQRQH